MEKELKNKEIMARAPFKMKMKKYGEGKNPIMKDRKKKTTMEKIKAAGGTASDIFMSNEPITAISKIGKTYQKNKAYQRYLSDKKKK